MNPARAGLSTGGKSAVVLVLIVIVLGATYLAPKPSGTTTSSTSSQLTVSAPSSGANTQAVGLLPLFGNFSQMQLQESAVDSSQGGNVALPQQVSVSYLVLGKGTLNSIQYTKVEFSRAGVANSNVIAWFNPNGGIDRVDVLGGLNYTGSGAPTLPMVKGYITAFSVIPVITSNSTLLSMLSKTSENMTSIGPSQLDVTTYHLVVPTHPYKSITAKFATIPGTSARLLVYFDQKMTDGSETIVEVLSLTK
ncbi:MAG TPA: hypothetical protein VEO75_04415 [Nitrososphaerales archaeon]|nr:hypothetical protein [Nitrososphaerales archaeon]